jgi:hypothetical protein
MARHVCHKVSSQLRLQTLRGRDPRAAGYRAPESSRSAPGRQAPPRPLRLACSASVPTVTRLSRALIMSAHESAGCATRSPRDGTLRPPAVVHLTCRQLQVIAALWHVCLIRCGDRRVRIGAGDDRPGDDPPEDMRGGRPAGKKASNAVTITLRRHYRSPCDCRPATRWIRSMSVAEGVTLPEA